MAYSLMLLMRSLAMRKRMDTSLTSIIVSIRFTSQIQHKLILMPLERQNPQPQHRY